MEVFERVARAAVEEASAVLRSTWLDVKTIQHKGAVDLVTETDRAIEAIIVSRIENAFPDHLVIAEESSGATALQPALDDQHVWYLDPLDGTTNFAHAYPHFAVSLALGRGRDLLFGIVHDPIRDETFVAEKNAGATLNGRPITVSSTQRLEDALLATGFPYDRREHWDFYLGFVGDLVQRAQGIRRNGSAALDLCYVACGRLDAFWEWKLRPWDTAAGALIVEEARGAISDFAGERFDPFGQQTLASNGHLHAAMREVLQARLAGLAVTPRIGSSA